MLYGADLRCNQTPTSTSRPVGVERIIARRNSPPEVAAATALGAGFMVQRHGQASKTIGGAQQPGPRRTREVCYGDKDDPDVWARDASSHVWRDGRLAPGAPMSVPKD